MIISEPFSIEGNLYLIKLKSQENKWAIWLEYFKPLDFTKKDLTSYLREKNLLNKKIEEGNIDYDESLDKCDQLHNFLQNKFSRKQPVYKKTKIEELEKFIEIKRTRVPQVLYFEYKFKSDFDQNILNQDNKRILYLVKQNSGLKLGQFIQNKNFTKIKLILKSFSFLGCFYSELCRTITKSPLETEIYDLSKIGLEMLSLILDYAFQVRGAQDFQLFIFVLKWSMAFS